SPRGHLGDPGTSRRTRLYVGRRGGRDRAGGCDDLILWPECPDRRCTRYTERRAVARPERPQIAISIRLDTGPACEPGQRTPPQQRGAAPAQSAYARGYEPRG